MPDIATPVVALDHVSVTYQSGPPWARLSHPAANDVTLEIAAGETVGLVGESGSGKTTIGKLVLGLLNADTGHVLFDGEPLARRRRRNADIQLVLQHPEWALNPFLKVGTSIAEPLAVAGSTTTKERRSKVGELLEMVGIEASMATRYPHQLSGGQRQRAAIARALISRPRLVVFDEAVSALDVSAQAQVLNLIKETQQQQGYAALFISHDLAAVRYVADRLIVMYLGSIVAEAAADVFYGRPKHPYAVALMEREDDPVTLGPPDGVTTSTGCPLAGRCPCAIERCVTDRPEMRVVLGQRVACHRADEL